MANFVYLCEHFQLLGRVAVQWTAMMLMLSMHIQIEIPMNAKCHGRKIYS